MEFTYHGMTRMAFGFQNPNHAAALIAILIPFCWGVRRAAAGRWWIYFSAAVAESALYVCLALTYSRSGFLALAVSGAAYLAAGWIRKSNDEATVAQFETHADSPSGKGLKNEFSVSRWLRVEYHRRVHSTTAMFSGVSKCRIAFLSVPLIVLISAMLASGAAGRLATILTPDASITNRFELWNGAARMFHDNPFGTGAGLSGKAYSVFYQSPERHLVYRTMVNSFLTFLTERGAVAGICALTLLAAALFLVVAVSRRADIPLARSLSAALVAIVVCGSSSTCFDANVLGDFSDANAIALNALLLTACGVVAASLVLGVSNLPRGLVFSIFAYAFSASAVVLMSVWALGIFIGDGVNRRVFKDSSGGAWIEITRAGHSKGRGMTALSEDDVIGERKLLSFLKNRFPKARLTFPINSDRGEASDAPGGATLVLTGRRASLAAASETPVIIFRPTAPPPAELHSSQVIKAYLDEYDEYGYNTGWESLLDNSRVEYIDAY